MNDGKVARSAAHLSSNRPLLRQYANVEEFGTDEPASKELRGAQHNLIQVRRAVLRGLWSSEIFVGVSVMDALLFDAFSQLPDGEDPVAHVLRFVQERGMHRPGFLVVPVHSFGIAWAGWLTFMRNDVDVSFFIDDYGLALAAQSNSMKKTRAFLDETRQRFGISQRLPDELLSHWIRSRGLHWLETNPLLLLKAASYPGGYYENQGLLISKLQFAAALVFLLSTLQGSSDDEAGENLSTRMVNNFETLDAGHYLVFFRGPRRELDGDCVPFFNQAPPGLVEIMDLGVSISPKHWERNQDIRQRVVDAVKDVQRGYFSTRFSSDRRTPRARVFRKLFNALALFRRSFRSRTHAEEAIVNLGAAFEILLTDNYSPGVGGKLTARLSLALAGLGSRKKRGLMDAVEGLYDARSQVIHTGDPASDIDIAKAQLTFVHAFLGVAEKLSRIPKTSSQPIGDILGDK